MTASPMNTTRGLLLNAPFAVKLLHTLPKLGYRLRVPDVGSVADDSR